MKSRQELARFFTDTLKLRDNQFKLVKAKPGGGWGSAWTVYIAKDNVVYEYSLETSILKYIEEDWLIKHFASWMPLQYPVSIIVAPPPPDETFQEVS